MKLNGKSKRRERREFSTEFKAEAVMLAAERRATGATLAQVGRERDVRPDQLRAWCRDSASACTTRKVNTTRAIPTTTVAMPR